MKIFSYIFFSIFFSLFAGILFLMFYMPYKSQKKNKPMDFRAAISKVKLIHGSATEYFIDLTNGESFLFTIPHNSATVGDSVIKNKDEELFTLKKPDGRVICQVDLYRKFIR